MAKKKNRHNPYLCHKCGMAASFVGSQEPSHRLCIVCYFKDIHTTQKAKECIANEFARHRFLRGCRCLSHPNYHKGLKRLTLIEDFIRNPEFSKKRLADELKESLSKRYSHGEES